jgi:hypothetical protein
MFFMLSGAGASPWAHAATDAAIAAAVKHDFQEIPILGSSILRCRDHRATVSVADDVAGLHGVEGGCRRQCPRGES